MPPKSWLASPNASSISRAKPPPRGNRQGVRRVENSSVSRGHPPRHGAGRQGKVMATTTGTAEPEALAEGEGVRRRDFINIAAISAAGVGGIVTLYPLISQMAPS